MNQSLFFTINNLAGHWLWLDRLGIFLGEYSPYVILAVLLIRWFSHPSRHDRLMIMMAIASGFVGRVLVEIIRWFYHHPRPFQVMSVHLLVPRDASYSFPSGHAAFFFGLSSLVFVYNRRLGTVFLITSLLMGLGRIFIGVHWPYDIIAGIITGIISTLIVLRLRPLIQNKTS